jgi:hypothetical protein
MPNLDLRFKSYEVFKISAQVQACYQPLSMQQILPKIVKKFFSSTLNIMISQMVRNENVRFGRHIDIEVSSKTYSWKYQNWLAFKRGCLEGESTLHPCT